MSANSVPSDLVQDVIDQNLEAVPLWNGRRLRAQHGRSQGCVSARFQVRDDLPQHLRHGLFAQPGVYQAALRFSNGAHLDDREPDAHGMAVKLFDVPGAKLIDAAALDHLGISQISEDFDFVLTDNDTFPSYQPEDYESLNRLVAAGQAIKHALSGRRGWSLRLIREGARAALRVLLTKEGKRHRKVAANFASNLMHSPFASHFWSTTPYQLGPDLTVRYLARSVRPDTPTEPVKDPDGIKQNLRRDVEHAENRFEFCIIEPPQTGEGFDPLDNRIRWARDPQPDAPLDPYHWTVTPVADITIARGAAFDPHDGDTLSFSPWRVTAEHAPLGPINAIRLGTYLSLARALSKSITERRSGMLDVDTLLDHLFVVHRGLASRLVALRLARAARVHRPRPLTLGADYTTWSGVYSHKWIGRHLPPQDPSPVLPPEDEVADLFRRRRQMDGSPLTLLCPQGSTILFISAAQWFTDSFLRTFGPNGPVGQTDSNHEVDLCQIYGLDDYQTDMLRERDPDTGALTHRMAVRTDEKGETWSPKLFQRTPSGGIEFAPPFDGSLATGKDAGRPLHNRKKLQDALIRARPDLDSEQINERLLDFHATGLDNGNGTIGYMVMNTLMLRAHNQLADIFWLQHRNTPGWDQERVFQTTRCALIAVLIKVVMEDYMGYIANMPFKLPVGVNRREHWQHSNQIAIEFNLLYRWHSMIPDRFLIDGVQVGTEGFRFNPRLVEETGLEKMIESLSHQPAARMSLRNTPDFMFEKPAADVPAPVEATIALTRKARLPSLNAYRHHFRRKPHASFAELVGDQPFADELVADLSRLYCNVDRVELFPGLFAEQHKGTVIMGDLMTSMVGYDAITQLMNNPMVSKNLYNEETFTARGFDVVKRTSTFADVAALVGLNPDDCVLGRRG